MPHTFLITDRSVLLAGHSNTRSVSMRRCWGVRFGIDLLESPFQENTASLSAFASPMDADVKKKAFLHLLLSYDVFLLRKRLTCSSAIVRTLTFRDELMLTKPGCFPLITLGEISIESAKDFSLAICRNVCNKPIIFLLKGNPHLQSCKNSKQAKREYAICQHLCSEQINFSFRNNWSPINVCSLPTYHTGSKSWWVKVKSLLKTQVTN